MKNELDSHLLLQVYEKIRLNGVEEAGVYELDGLKAYTDPDGYTLYMEDKLVKLRLGFHNKYHLDYEKPEHFDLFEKRLHAIDKAY